MKQKILVAVFILLLVITSLSSVFPLETVSSSDVPTLYVNNDYDDTTPGWGIDRFSSIQDAIDNSTSGHRIIVYNGTYSGNIIIPHRLDLFGENRATTIIAGTQTNSVIKVSADYVNISHFTIRNSEQYETSAVIRITSSNTIITDNDIRNGYHGIYITDGNNHLIYDNIIRNNSGDGIRSYHSNQNTITYNTISNNFNGMLLYACQNTKVHNNTMTNNNANGIFLNDTSTSNTFQDNIISSNTENGIFLLNQCNDNKIFYNTLYSNIGTGVRIENSSINVVDNNNVNSNFQYGFLVTGSGNIISNNTISSNKRHGMFLFADDNSLIENNSIQANTYEGIRSYNSTSDTIRNNIISSNAGYGIYLDFFTLQNRIYNNKIYGNSQKNALDKTIGGRNIWNTSKTEGLNIIGGQYLGGNYWDDYTGPDTGDGLGSNYTIETSAVDRLPLVDVHPPSISNVQITPPVQTTQGYLTISATVTDDLQVTDVRLLLTDPTNKKSNFSILQNKTGNVYSCKKTYSVIGEYSFHILATDSRHWVSSAERTFIIQPGIPPTIRDYSPTTGVPYHGFTFNVSVTDDTDPASQLTVKVNWKHGQHKGNITLPHTRNNFFMQTVQLDKSLASMTYTIYASDYWGNAVVTEQKTVTMQDTEPPEIVVTKYGPSFQTLPNSFTFGALITDNVAVSSVTLEYWYEEDVRFTTEMNKKNATYYEKVIIPVGSPERIYCVITAYDSSGNSKDTKNPFPVTSKDIYHGVLTIPVLFDASKSFDLDGYITSYEWDFGDGTTGEGSTPSHIYSADGTYTVTLTIKDNEGNTATRTVLAKIINLEKIEPSDDTFGKIKQEFNLTLSQKFFCYDSTGDMIADSFFDPNGVLTAVHEGYLNLSGAISFLLSIDDAVIPEFFWNTTNDTIVPVVHKVGEVHDRIINALQNTATVSVYVNKTDGWIFIEAPDEYPHADLTAVHTGERMIDLELVWRKNGNVYVLDDPDVEYLFVYHGITQAPVLEEPVFYPVEGGVINEDSPSITITYNVPVLVMNARFGEIVISPSEFITTDEKVFVYTPPSTLEDKTYTFSISVSDYDGNMLESSVVYFYFSYVIVSEQTEFSIPFSWVGIGLLFLGGLAVFFLIRTKRFNFQEFIYLKNRRIIPFVKPVVIGPVSVRIDDNKIHKAEFYVDGQLKETLTKPPFYWSWNEPVFLKHTLETKIYDAEGNSSSSGEKEMYIFNPFSSFSSFFSRAAEE